MKASRTKSLEQPTLEEARRDPLRVEPKAAPVIAPRAEERRRLSEDYVTRADLYAEAKRRGIEGRSKLTKAELLDLLSGR